MALYREYVILGARYGHTFERDSDEYCYLVYAPDGTLVGDRWTRRGAEALVDGLLLAQADPDGDGSTGVDPNL